MKRTKDRRQDRSHKCVHRGLRRLGLLEDRPVKRFNDGGSGPKRTHRSPFIKAYYVSAEGLKIRRKSLVAGSPRGLEKTRSHASLR